MKKFSLMAGVAGIAALVAVLWSMPAAADIGSGASPVDPARVNHDRMMQYHREEAGDKADDPAGVPEPGTLALLALGLSGIGVAAAKRRRNRN